MGMNDKEPLILGIESSCDDTGAAVVRGRMLLSNVTASQAVHTEFGGVVPEMASRAHQENIVPVVATALKRAGVNKEQIDAVACTALVDGSFDKGNCIDGCFFAPQMAEVARHGHHSRVIRSIGKLGDVYLPAQASTILEERIA